MSQPAPAAEPRPKVEELRLALIQLFGAERRLRGRDHSHPDREVEAAARIIHQVKGIYDAVCTPLHPAGPEDSQSSR